eukprot:CAMPEP_0119016076 /NCGR_PEP_ID=MMETSP1176-20130426/11802_1 /TAXON_ID=265551 /ORGANISM="Synedropsis recta cf, Strain CCMP1620" /LENGTH=200 /DNA_ID=CAMNT_0006969403 /DNA_START=85 /DNA_END=684 /DNA_ORIENTATION=+
MIKRTWQLLAPANYPGGRRIEALTPEGNTIFVKVPEPGVARGTAFVGEEIPKPQPVTERWHDAICNCGSEGTFCCLVFLWPAAAWASIMDKIGFSFLGHINPSLRQATFVIMVGAPIILIIHQFQKMHQVLALQAKAASSSAAGPSKPQFPPEADDGAWMDLTLVAALLSWYLIIIFTLTRRAVRKMYKIRGNCCTDCLW